MHADDGRDLGAAVGGFLQGVNLVSLFTGKLPIGHQWFLDLVVKAAPMLSQLAL